MEPERATLAFTVPGLPAPQGSKTNWGTEDNPRTKPWRAAVAAEAAAQMQDRALLTGPLQLRVEFRFPRPKSHFGSGRNSEQIRPAAPDYHTARPDLDKLARAIGDALTGVVWRDDSQIAHLNVWKMYGATAQAVITVRQLSVSSLVAA